MRRTSIHPYVLGSLIFTLAACAGAPTTAPRSRADVVAHSHSTERRTLDAATWARAVARGDYVEVPVPGDSPRSENDCFSPPAPVPEGSVRLGWTAPAGGRASLYRERGGDGVWVVAQTTTLDVPPGPHGDALATPSTRCFEVIVALPPGTHRAGSIDVR